MKILKDLLSILLALLFMGLLIAYLAYCGSFLFKPFMETPFVCVGK